MVLKINPSIRNVQKINLATGKVLIGLPMLVWLVFAKTKIKSVVSLCLLRTAKDG